MSLEGRLRDLRPLELCQLLSSSRKSGVLLVRAPLHARAMETRFVDGAVVAASQWPLHRLPSGALEPGAQQDAATPRAIADAVLDLLTWREGDFRFVAATGTDRAPSTLRVALEPLLVEAMQRADVWERVADRVAGPRVIPTFVDVDPQQLPLLRLSPQAWEALTRVDGQRDLAALADALGRDVLDVAQIIHSLIGAGLLTVRDAGTVPRRHPTPPAQSRALAADREGVQVGDLWIPPTSDLVAGDPTVAADSIFDPVTAGVTSAEWHEVSHGWLTAEISVASTSGDPSKGTGQAGAVDPSKRLAARGDAAARRGDLPEALTLWSAALRSAELAGDADRIREAIALAARLHALLHPSRSASTVPTLTRAS